MPRTIDLRDSVRAARHAVAEARLEQLTCDLFGLRRPTDLERRLARAEHDLARVQRPSRPHTGRPA